MKRILALDGGGIRGLFSLQILARIEELFRQEQGKPALVLADIFHFFAGTSTGAIIATCLAWGMSVEAIQALYVQRSTEMFTKESWYRRWKAKYRADAIAQCFRGLFCEDVEGRVPAVLGSKRLRTLLLIVMRNASTGSPWPVSNNPHSVFSGPSSPGSNLNIPLWQLLRASTAAPAFFRPQEINVGGARHLFVDGGITPYNNPALIAVLMATLPPYRLCWPATREELHVVSVGTGTALAHLPRKAAEKINIVDQLAFAIPALMGSVMWEQDLVCRVLGDCVYGAPMDSELGALDEPSLLGRTEQKFTYVRYDQLKKASGLEAKTQQEPKLDSISQIPVLQQAGQKYAAQHVRREHLYPRNR